MGVKRTTAARTWVVVASLDQARRGLHDGFIMASHGKRAPVQRMAAGDRLLVYSPKTNYPGGDRFQAVAIVGVVTAEEPEPSTVITGGFRRRADLRETDPLPPALLRDHLPTSRIRFGFFELSPAHAQAIFQFVPRTGDDRCPRRGDRRRAAAAEKGVTRAEPRALPWRPHGDVTHPSGAARAIERLTGKVGR